MDDPASDVDAAADSADELRIALTPPQLAVVLVVLAIVVAVIIRRRRASRS